MGGGNTNDNNERYPVVTTVIPPVMPILPPPPPPPIVHPIYLRPMPPPPPPFKKSLAVTVQNNSIKIGNNFTLTLERTLRIPDDGKVYPLPPSLGRFPICKVDDYIDRVPESWRQHGGVFIPMYQREAMWLKFMGNHSRPNAVKVAVGKVNAINGKPWSESLSSYENDYVVVPDQPWLDGINNGNGTIKQFVAMPLGSGYTVEGQVTGKEEFGGLQLVVYDAKYGARPKHNNAINSAPWSFWGSQNNSNNNSNLNYAYNKATLSAHQHQQQQQQHYALGSESAEMGLAAGGQMKQKIYTDRYGIDAWDQTSSGRIYIHIVNSAMYFQITGMMPPASPISAQTYSAYGYPWFDIYDENKRHVNNGNLPWYNPLSNVQSVAQIDQQVNGWSLQDNTSIPFFYQQPPKPPGNVVRDGNW